VTLGLNSIFSKCGMCQVFAQRVTYVSGSEKWGKIAQNAKFHHFSSYHHFKAVRTSDFILGLWVHQAFCFTDPMFEAVDSLLSEVRYKTTDFHPRVVCVLATPTQEMGGAWNS